VRLRFALRIERQLLAEKQVLSNQAGPRPEQADHETRTVRAQGYARNNKVKKSALDLTHGLASYSRELQVPLPLQFGWSFCGAQVLMRDNRSESGCTMLDRQE